MKNKKIIIIGAGPAGLTAAYELLDKSKNYDVIVLEASNYIGGISRTVDYKGNRMDMGGHRLFSKVPEVNEWWEKIMPMQGSLAYDDKVLGRTSAIKEGGPDPEKEDLVMLYRHRLSCILFDQKFFDYPLSFKISTIKNLGLSNTLAIGCSYLKSSISKRSEESLEDFYINRFGKKLYSTFFEDYTEKLWGRHPKQISPEWGAQRVKGISIAAITKDILGKTLHLKREETETSFIEKFSYPKLGPGQLWEAAAEKIESMGGRIIKNAKVIGVKRNNLNKVTAIVYRKNGKNITIEGDYFISSMPIKDLISSMDEVPKRYKTIAKGLPYRDFITVGILTNKLALKNKTDVKTLGNIVPDNWIYVHNKNIKMCRMQIYNNWSPYLVKDPKHTVWLGLEYFCNQGDKFWHMADNQIAEIAIKEAIESNIIINKTDVIDFHVERVEKAYPAYFDTYSQINDLRAYLDAIPNLFLVGRNGQHRYNNLDHSMCTSFEAVKNIMNGTTDKSNIWNVNTEKEYHEVTNTSHMAKK